MADPLDGTVTDNTHKKWDLENAPLHRINSPSYNNGQFTRAPGDGVNRGCRTSGLQRVLPAWVTVQDNPFKEIEGRLARSYQTWTDFPLAQWHIWYDWNFHVIPTDPYSYVRGSGNQEITGHGTPVVQGATMECEWDAGAFGTKPGPMFAQDWAWPMASQFVWVAGRWVYDCSHADSAGRMRSELHPIGAVATVRVEAQKFSSNAQVLYPFQNPLGIDTPFMPGVQFMFFASRLGGYITVPEALQTDYEFIVDLPKEIEKRAIAPIGPAPPDPQNTISLGPLRIVYQVDFTPFSNAAGSVNNTNQPVLTVIMPADGSFPSQVKIKIPMKGVVDSYGVMISIGVIDQFLDLAKRVVLVSGSFDNATLFRQTNVDGVIKYGINGRWHIKNFQNMSGGASIALNENFSFALALDHPPNGGGAILLSSHGMITHPAGKVMEEPDAARTLRVANQPGGRVYQWDFDIIPDANGIESALTDRMKSAGHFVWSWPPVAGDENEPLGVSDFSRRINQLQVSTTQPFQLKGFSLNEDQALAEIFFKSPQQTDYLIDGKITVKTQ
jgi:hypothetical protein